MTDNDIQLDQQGPRNASDPSNDPARPHTPGYTDLRRGLISLILGMGSYYGARYLSATELAALMISTAVSAVRVGYTAMRARRLDPIAAFLLAADGVTVIVGLASQSPAITMLGSHIPGVVFEIFVIIGLIRSRPITESLIEWFRPGWIQHHIANHTWSDGDARAYHRTHMRLTLAVGIAQILHLTAATIVIFTLPVDIAKGLLGALALGTDAIVLAIILGGIGYFLRRDRTPPPVIPNRAAADSR
ncbi:VC0807 family protein [Mycobacterium haemophilum]|uniref:VC0807 family protein n=1 Tax=Mycobacterium haemophilum TaxID=29311 RepID=UPI00069BDDA2|nr:VC0807 family protein [Mycobacterium haemophilum]